MGWLDRILGRGSRPAVLYPDVSSPRPPQTPPPAQTPVAPRSGFAVLDVETTGLSPRNDRVVSIALVLTDAWGRVEHEWSTLVNPLGPVGATHIHGITDADVAAAPTFDRLAIDVLALVRNRAVVAHNATFDLGFLTNELARIGWAWPTNVPTLCTLQESMYFQPHLERRRLTDCCAAAGVRLVNAHSALGDARAAAGLFSSYVRSSPTVPVARGYDTLLARATTTAWPTSPGHPVAFPAQGASRGRSLSARALKSIAAASTPRPRLLESFTLSDALDGGASPSALPYLELLAEALEDGELDDRERNSLADLISQYALPPDDIAGAHRGFIRALAREAVEDGRTTTAERRELVAIAGLLGVSEREVTGLLSGEEEDRRRTLSANLPELPESWTLGEPLRVGQGVAFTGCETAGRDLLEKRTVEAGLRVMSNVSRRTSALVSDGTVDGTKARAARELGVRIVHPDAYRTLLSHRQPQLVSPVSTPRPSHAAAAQAVAADTSTGRPAPAVVRTWALANGYEVGTRGRIHSDIWTAYALTHEADGQ